MATAVFTTVEARVNQQLTNAIWKDELQDNINALAGSHRNLFVNGGFEPIGWQRGVGPFTTNNAYTADRWQMVINTGSMTVTQETSVVDSASAAALKVVATAAGDSIQQRIEGVVELRGREISVSLRFQQSVSNANTLLVLRSNAGSFASAAAAATTGAYQTVTVTGTVPSGATSLDVVMQMGAAGTYYLDNAMLVIGPAPAPYRPLHPQEELARCQRYHEVMGGVNTSVGVLGYGAAGTNCGNYIPFKVQKGGTPTVTKNGTWAVLNCSQPAALNISPDGFSLVATVTALGAYSFNCNSSDDTITASWEP